MHRGGDTAEHFAVENDTAAHSRAESDENDVAHTAAAAVHIFAPRGAICVVGGFRMLSRYDFDKMRDGDIPPSEIGAIAHGTRTLVHDPGYSQPYSVHFVKIYARIVAQAADIRDYVFEYLRVRSSRVGLDRIVGNDIAFAVDKPYLDIGASDVYARVNHMRHLSVTQIL